MNFKRINILAFICLISVNQATATQLPFIGTLHFNFEGGSSTEQSITIQKNGMTTIKWYGDAETAILYRGRYQQYLPININIYPDKHYYKIANSKQILRLDKNKKLENDCQPKYISDDEYDERCIAELY